MKKFFIILIFVRLATSIFAQIPEGFSYQAVIRDNNETLVKSQTVAVKASILRNNEVVFTQTLNAVTNDNGLMTLTIGGTTEFSEIDWTHGPLIIKTQIDPAGGDNYTIETETQLLAVPFAMAAKTAETALNVPDLDNLLEKINYLEEQIEEIKSQILKNCEWQNIFPIVLSEQLMNKLDIVFSQNNPVIANLQGNILFNIINNIEELLNVSNDILDGIEINIDFENQSFIWGRIIVPAMPYSIYSKHLLFCDNTSNYEFRIEIEKCIECWTMLGKLYFWGVFPNQIDINNITLIIEYF